MAVKLKTELKGIHADFYCKVTTIGGGKAQGFNYVVEAFVNQSAANVQAVAQGRFVNSLGVVEQGNIAFNPQASGDIIAQCYADLKHKDAWKGAVDC